MKRLNKYLFYALALFPIIDFAILNIITILFFITIPFDLKAFSKIKKEKVFFIIILVVLTIIPLTRDYFHCSLTYWFAKVAPLYISSVLLLFAPPFITNKEYKRFKNIYIIGAILYIVKFVSIILIELYSGKLEVIFEKKILFYSDIMNLLGSEISILDSNYHKPYFSLIILLALLFATEKFIKEKRKRVNFCLILFFLVWIIFPMSLPNIVIILIYLSYTIFFLYRKNKIILSTSLFVFTGSVVLFLFYNSYKHNNLDITEDINFIVDHLKGDYSESEFIQANPRKIIYTALLKKIDEVPILGFGYCDGKNTVTEIIEESINKTNTETTRNNFLIDTESMDSHLWKKNGVRLENNNSWFSMVSSLNNCQSHTLYQVVDDLIKDETYTFSVSVKSEQSNVIIRLGQLNNQMIVFDLSQKQFSFIGSDILKHEVEPEDNEFYRISIATKIKDSKNIALIGFYGKNNQYNHCSEKEVLKIKKPQLELGSLQTNYVRGFSKNEKNVLGAKINAHNIFLQEYYLGGVVGFVSIILFYGWLLFLGKSGGDKLLIVFLLALIFNSFFENIQYRQIGISLIIILSILLIFKKKE
jgi:hypothetical protein